MGPFQPGHVSNRKPETLVSFTINLLFQKEGPTLQEPLLLAPEAQAAFPRPQHSVEQADHKASRFKGIKQFPG